MGTDVDDIITQSLIVGTHHSVKYWVQSTTEYCCGNPIVGLGSRTNEKLR